jgi:hypothetical protein
MTDDLYLVAQLREKLKEQYIESARAWKQVELLRQEVADLRQGVGPSDDALITLFRDARCDDYFEDGCDGADGCPRCEAAFVALLREALAAHQQVGA